MKIWKYGDNINTDMLFPGKYTYTCATPEEIKPHLLEDLDPSFAGNVKTGDVVLLVKTLDAVAPGSSLFWVLNPFVFRQ